MTPTDSGETAGPAGPAVSRGTEIPVHDSAGGRVSRETTGGGCAPAGAVQVPLPNTLTEPNTWTEPDALTNLESERTTLSCSIERVFGDRVDLAGRFAAHLTTSGVERGLIGPRETQRIWSRHILNCAVVGELISAESSVIDIGSGAGLPGLALAIARPDLHVTLVEPLERRTSWLHEVVADLGLSTRVVRARAEDVVGHEWAAVVTARAVAALPRLAEWGLPLVEPGGQLLAIKGRSAADELASAATRLRRLGAVSFEVLRCGTEVQEESTTVVRVSMGRGSTQRAGSIQRSARRKPS